MDKKETSHYLLGNQKNLPKQKTIGQWDSRAPERQLPIDSVYMLGR
jgi:hypothetical protein